MRWNVNDSKETEGKNMVGRGSQTRRRLLWLGGPLTAGLLLSGWSAAGIQLRAENEILLFTFEIVTPDKTDPYIKKVGC